MSTSSRRKCRPRLKFVSKAVEPSFMEAREGINRCLCGSLLNILDFFLESTIGRNIRLSRVLQWFRTCPIVQMSFQFADRIFCYNAVIQLQYSCKSSIPYSQFLRLRKICSYDADFDIEAAKMETFFTARGYPNDLIRKGRERASTKSRAEILKSDAANNIAKDRVPFVTTFHPSNLVKKIISRNFRILREDSRTS